MNADAFRHYYDYHFSQNRKIWDEYILPLSPDQFTQPLDYSHGSVRNQVVHLMQVDEAWFGDLTGSIPEEPFTDGGRDDREAIRAHWDRVEAHMRAYLADIKDEMLMEKPFTEGEDKDLILWQILVHVVNHGTDHRAQLLRLLSDLGVQTQYQDYIFYAYEHPVGG